MKDKRINNEENKENWEKEKDRYRKKNIQVIEEDKVDKEKNQ